MDLDAFINSFIFSPFLFQLQWHVKTYFAYQEYQTVCYQAVASPRVKTHTKIE